MFIIEPTVVWSSVSDLATQFIAAFSISATIAGVASTGRSPDPITAAVNGSVTTSVEIDFAPISINIGTFEYVVKIMIIFAKVTLFL